MTRKFFYPSVYSEEETLQFILEGASIGRYGDGELKICRGASIKCQKFDPNLSERLKKILRGGNNEHKGWLVGIPNIQDLSQMNDQKRKFWSTYQKETEYYNFNREYCSSFITRPDSVPRLFIPRYFDAIKKIWENREVILINGNNRRFDKDPTILDSAICYERWEQPAQDAWAGYKALLSRCLGETRHKLFLIALGPTATVLAYDLWKEGYQAIDIGHIGMFYARIRGESEN